MPAASPWKISRSPAVPCGDLPCGRPDLAAVYIATARRGKWRLGNGRPAAQQRLARGPFLGGIEALQEPRLAGSKNGDRPPVAIEQAIAGEGRQPGAWCQHADEVERIRRRDRDERAASRLAAHLAELADRLGKGELLTGETGHETAAPDLADPSSRRYTRSRSRQGGSQSASCSTRRQKTTP